jgi:hypothetical protein
VHWGRDGVRVVTEAGEAFTAGKLLLTQSVGCALRPAPAYTRADHGTRPVSCSRT